MKDKFKKLLMTSSTEGKEKDLAIKKYIDGSKERAERRNKEFKIQAENSRVKSSFWNKIYG